VVDSGRREVKAMAAKKQKRKKPKSRNSTKAKSKTSAKAKAKRKKAATKPKSRERMPRGRAEAGELLAHEPRGLGARSAGQSGDTQGLDTNSAVDSESVEELLEEGQSFEAEILNGVENAPDPDKSEVRTREIRQDDVPEEYREKD
jgi:hypothetical protein